MDTATIVSIMRARWPDARGAGEMRVNFTHRSRSGSSKCFLILTNAAIELWRPLPKDADIDKMPELDRVSLNYRVSSSCMRFAEHKGVRHLVYDLPLDFSIKALNMNMELMLAMMSELIETILYATKGGTE